MASRAHKNDQVEEVGTPDFAMAVRIYKQDIKPAQSKVGEFAQEQSTAFKAIKKNANIQPQAAKAAFAIFEMEESKRDDYLRSLNGLFKELGVSIKLDMVDIAEGKTGGDIIPAAATTRQPPKLVTIAKSPPPGDTDLSGGDDTGSLVDKLGE